MAPTTFASPRRSRFAPDGLRLDLRVLLILSLASTFLAVGPLVLPSSAAGGVVELRRDCWTLQGCDSRIIVRGDGTANSLSLSLSGGYYWFSADSPIFLPKPPELFSYNDCHFYTDDHTEARCPASDPGLRELYVVLGEGNDQLTGGLGPHLFYAQAGEGDDVIQVSDSFDPSLTAPHSRVLRGGPGNDRLFGDDNLGQVYGDAGHDFLNGGGGADRLEGGSGSDTVSYAGRSTPVHVTIGGCCEFDDGGVEDSTGTARDRVVAGVENLVGGNANDTLVGDDASNTFSGGPGADDIHGAGGAEDTATYANRTASVFVAIDNLSNDGYQGEGDNVHTDVENLVGGLGNDYLNGTEAANRIVGGAGNDAIGAIGGPDILVGGSGGDTLSAGEGDDFVDGGAGGDHLVGWRGADVLRGGDADDSLYPGVGKDLVIDGGPGFDKVSYDWAYASGIPVAVSLDGIANDGADLGHDGVGEEGDNVWLTVEVVWGGPEADRLVGSSGSDHLVGMDGADRLIGRGGSDVLGSSDPTLSAGNDVLIGGPGNDGMYGGPGNDTACARDGDVDVIDGGPNTITGSDTAQFDGKLDHVSGIEQTLGPKAPCP